MFGKNKPKLGLMSTATEVESESHKSSFLSKLSELHNASLYCQQTQNYEETIAYIKKSISQIKLEKKTHEYLPSLILLKKYKILRTLQLSAVLSFVKNHQQALVYAKKALKSTFSIFETVSDLVSKLSKKAQKSEKTLKLKKIIDKILSHNFEPPNIILTQSWVNHYNMGNIMTIQEFQVSDWNKSLNVKGVCSFSFITQCIFLLIASYFTIATETRLSETIKNNSKDWYRKAIELCNCFLPSSSAILQHIQNSYKKHWNSGKKEELQRIPSVKRFSIKRTSEKPRNVSEKNIQKFSESPPRKLTPSTKHLQRKIKINKLKKSIRATAPFEVACELNETKKTSVLKERLLRKKSVRNERKKSGSFDGKI